MSNEATERKSYKYLNNVVDSLFVMSQEGLKKKLTVIELTKSLEGLSGDEHEKLKREINGILRDQRYFQSQRQAIIRYMLEQDIASFNTYIVVKNVTYGLVKIKSRKFYCVVNKKLIKKFKAVQNGTSFIEFNLLSDDELAEIIDYKDAKRIFKLYHALIERKKKKNKTKIVESTIEKTEKKNYDKFKKKPIVVKAKRPWKQKIEKQEPAVIGQSVSEGGSIMVIRKRKLLG